MHLLEHTVTDLRSARAVAKILKAQGKHELVLPMEVYEKVRIELHKEKNPPPKIGLALRPVETWGKT